MANQRLEQASPSAQSLYRSCQQLEKQIRGSLASKTPLDSSVVKLRETLKAKYESLLFLDFHYAVSKDVELNLWKNVFYKVIEECRRRIRKQAVIIKDRRTREDGSSKRSTRDGLQQACSYFHSFLSSSASFYHDLINKLQEKFDLTLDGSVDLSKSNDGLRRVYACCHRSLIFLGDLVRYHRDLVGEKVQGQWVNASIYYQQALILMPSNGNPHNQLAVLATYVDDEFNAVYRYFRSLAVTQPFLTARENLMVLFEKNRLKVAPLLKKREELVGSGGGGGRNGKKYKPSTSNGGAHTTTASATTTTATVDAATTKKKEATSATTSAEGGGGASASAGTGGGGSNGSSGSSGNGSGSGGSDQQLLEVFLTCFVRIHGILFTRTGFDSLHSLKLTVFKDFDALFQRNSIKPDLLLRLLVINVFSFHNSFANPSEGQAADSLKALQRHTSSFVVEFFGRAARQCHCLGDFSFKRGMGGRGSQPLNIEDLSLFDTVDAIRCSRHLGAVCMFMDWMKNNPSILRPAHGQEKRSWIGMWKSVCQLLSRISRSFKGTNIVLSEAEKVNDCVPFLQEEVELRGFLPLLGVGGSFSCAIKPPPYPFQEEIITGPKASTSPIEVDSGLPDVLRASHLARMAKAVNFGIWASERDGTPKLLYYSSEEQRFSARQPNKKKRGQSNGKAARNFSASQAPERQPNGITLPQQGVLTSLFSAFGPLQLNDNKSSEWNEKPALGSFGEEAKWTESPSENTRELEDWKKSTVNDQSIESNEVFTRNTRNAHIGSIGSPSLAADPSLPSDSYQPWGFGLNLFLEGASALEQQFTRNSAVAATNEHVT